MLRSEGAKHSKSKYYGPKVSIRLNDISYEQLQAIYTVAGHVRSEPVAHAAAGRADPRQGPPRPGGAVQRAPRRTRLGAATLGLLALVQGASRREQ